MDPQLAEIRRQKAQEYKSVPEAAKPKIATCPDCGKGVYDCAICERTGYLHLRHTNHLVAGLLVDGSKRQFSGTELMSAIDAVRVRWQPSRVSLVKADATSLNIFQSFVYSMDWKMQRYGILFGTVDATSHEVRVHCIYEPEQVGNATGFKLEPDARESRVNEIAKLLGLRRVGCVCTHSARDEEAVTLSGKELLLCAQEQSKYGDHCVLITMGPNLETGHINAQCWQASEQCVRYYQMAMLSEVPDDIQVIRSEIPLEIAQEDADKAGHKRCVIKESSNTVDTRWMTSYIAVEAFASDVVGSNFVRISRPGCAPPTFANLRIFLQDQRRVRLPFVEKIADFHVLIFLAENVFDVACDMPGIIDAILKKKNDAASIYEEILKERMKAV